MKADQLNRFVRTNGRQNLWLLRNTNTIYEQAVKSYYQRSNSLLPYNPTSQEHKKREENRAPVRTLTSQHDRSSLPEYPRNHKQMTEQTTAANSGNLLSTVMQANRRRSMSFTGSSLRDYIYPNSRHKENMSDNSNNDKLRNGQPRGMSLTRTNPKTTTTTGKGTATAGSGLDVVEQLDLGILSGRSISLPPRSSLDLGNVDLAVRKAKKPPCHKHHIDAIEKSTTAAVAALAQHRQRKTGIDKLDSEQLMTIDDTLKQRLAVRFDRERDRDTRPAEPNVVAARMLSARPPAKPAATSTTTTANKEQTRFQTLGERIRQFECMQFANGPAAFQAFNRRQGHGNGRVSLMGNKHIPKQQPCLSFRNVLHTNHRQRCLLSSQTQTRSQSVSSSLPLAPAKAKSRTKTLKRSPEPTLMASWRPQQQQQQPQQQQQQRQLQPSPAAPTSSTRFNQAKLKRSKSRRYIKTAVSSSSGSSNSSSSQSSNGFLILDGPRHSTSKPSKMKAKAKEHVTVGASNHLSRSSHMPYIKHCGNKLTDSPSPSNAPSGGKRLAEQLRQPEGERKVLPQRKMMEELPKQPLMAKGAHHLLAASASQVSAYRRAFKNRQQILQAELFHVYAHDQPQSLLSSKTTLRPKSPLPRQAKSDPQTQASSTIPITPTSTVPSPSTISTPQLQSQPSPIPNTSLSQPKKEEAKVTPPKPLVQHSPTPPESVTMTVKKTKVAKNASAPHASSSLTTLPELATETSFMVIDAKPKWSPVLQQQQLHQQLRQRRQQPYDSLWRYNY